MEKLTCTVEEAGKALGVSRAIAYKLSRSEGFPTIRIGRKVLISVQGLKDWIAKQTAQGGVTNGESNPHA